jgi:hypothetical protein
LEVGIDEGKQEEPMKVQTIFARIWMTPHPTPMNIFIRKDHREEEEEKSRRTMRGGGGLEFYPSSVR